MAQRGFFIPIIIVVIAVTSIASVGGYIAVQNAMEHYQGAKDAPTPTPLSSDQVENSKDMLQENVQEEMTKEINKKSSESEQKTQENMAPPTATPQQPTHAQKQKTKDQDEERKPTEKQQQKNDQSSQRYVDSPRPGAGFIFIDSELQLSASRELSGIRLSWTRCNSDQFVAYKIAKSETASDVSFPRDGSIASIPNQNTLTYIDTHAEPGKTYFYRICSLEKNGESWCGNAVTIRY